MVNLALVLWQLIVPVLVHMLCFFLYLRPALTGSLCCIVQCCLAWQLMPVVWLSTSKSLRLSTKQQSVIISVKFILSYFLIVNSNLRDHLKDTFRRIALDLSSTFSYQELV